MKRTADHQELIDLALGRLAPRRREELERRLAADAGAARRYEEVRAHLSRYDAWPALDAPTFARLGSRLPSQATGFVPYVRPARWAAGALLALLVVSLGAALLLRPPQRGSTGRMPTEPAFRAGSLIRVERGGGEVDPAGPPRSGDVLVADAPDRAWIGDRVEAVLDTGARMTYRSQTEVTLDHGRVFFRVASTPFRVSTRGGVVEVRGTAFEVSVEGAHLRVAVEEGMVEVGDIRLGPGERVLDGRSGGSGVAPGSFFRRPVLEVDPLVPLTPGRLATFRFTLRNPGPDPLRVARPGGGRVALWLSFEGEGGDLEPELPVPGAERAFTDGLPSGPIALAPRASRTWDGRIPALPLLPGSYRCLALYRPQDETPVVSQALLLEVAE